MLDIPSISAIVAAVGVIVGVVFTVMELRNLVKQRQTDLVVRLYSTFIGKECLDATMEFLALQFEDYNDYVKKYGDPVLSGNPVHKAMLIVDNFFNQVGILLHRKLIDVGLVRDVFTYRVELLWKKAEPIIQGFRREHNQPEAGKWFEYLYNEMKKREQTLQQTQQ